MCAYHTEKKATSQSIEGVFPIYKKAGETLATLVTRFRVEQSFSFETPITYAGRLDPMASGLVLLLVGDTCKQKDAFLGLDKTYTFEILFGVSTDSFDMLGLVTAYASAELSRVDIEGVLPSLQDLRTFPYPPFSSKPVDGVPLFAHAKAGTLPEVMPTMVGQIKELRLERIRTTSYEDVVGQAIETIERVEGDFRQKEVVVGWQAFLEEQKNQRCVVATCEATVTSGVYIRTLATLIGQAIGLPALAYGIDRTQVGEYKET